MTVINLTPHAVIFTNGENSYTFPPSGKVARATSHVAPLPGFAVDDLVIPRARRVVDGIVDLPDPEPYTLYIVSSIVLAACPDRTDLIAPDNFIRDDQGRIVACQGFVS